MSNNELQFLRVSNYKSLQSSCEHSSVLMNRPLEEPLPSLGQSFGYMAVCRWLPWGARVESALSDHLSEKAKQTCNTSFYARLGNTSFLQPLQCRLTPYYMTWHRNMRSNRKLWLWCHISAVVTVNSEPYENHLFLSILVQLCLKPAVLHIYNIYTGMPS